MAMCYGISQPASARRCWMRRWRPWTTAFFMVICLCSIGPTSTPHTDFCTAETLGLAPRALHHRGYSGSPQGETDIRLGWLQRHLQSPAKTTNVGSSTCTSPSLLTFRTTSVYPSLPQRAISVVSTCVDGHGGETNNMILCVDFRASW